MRERLFRRAIHARRFRITPACAGKTVASMTESLSRGDHPRMCGKDYGIRYAWPTGVGSPPHVRERLMQDVIRGPNGGITPACAGKTGASWPGSWADGDHPRMCGKDMYIPIRYRATRGSPPHVRERLRGFLNAFHNDRITPACAGKTRFTA